MTYLYKEISAISFQNENWKLFIQTTHKDMELIIIGLLSATFGGILVLASKIGKIDNKIEQTLRNIRKEEQYDTK